jgi:4-amino-4-deoxy-L-arabinose transferase-like glycosyltransferase
MPSSVYIRQLMPGSVRSPEIAERVGERAIGRYLALWVILLSAFGLRLFCMNFLTGTIGTEGAEYARIAENLLAGKGYIGIATEGTEFMFPPLFPFLIAAFSFLTHQVETAGRLVSALMGTLLVAQVYLITGRLYGRQIGKVAGVLAALHPFLLTFSTAVYSEVTYAALVLTGVYWGQRCYSDRQLRAFLLAGFFYGLAYLTRPEASLYPFLTVFLVLGLQLFTDRRRLPRVALYGCLLIGVSLILAAPYVAWLSHETGQFRIESKSPIIYAMDHGIVSGLDPSDVQYGIDQNLDKRGVWMVSNMAVIQSTKMSVTGLIQLAEAGVKQSLPSLLKNISISPSFGSLVLFGLTLLGLVFTKWDRKTIGDQLFLFMVLGVTAFSLLFHPGNVSLRYTFLFLPVMIMWAAKGVVVFSGWSGAKIAAAPYFALSPRRAALTVQLACVLIIFLVSMVGLYRFPPLWSFDHRNKPIKVAGEWLDEFSPGPKTVMDNSTLVAFHARASYLHFPYTSEPSAFRYIEKNKVDFIVLMSEAIDDTFPYMKKWMNDGIPDRRAQLIYSVDTSQLGRVVIYKWNHAGADSEGLPLVSPIAGHMQSLSYRGSEPVDPIAAKGPLKINAENPRYFADSAGRPVYLAGAHTWSNFQDAEPLASFDYGGYLNFLAAHNLNFMRLWVWEQADWVPWRPYHYRLLPMPYLRPGPGPARDGEPRMDLTKYDPSYFQRLRSHVMQAGAKGIYVSIMLFNGYSVERKHLDGEDPWLGHPFYRGNNINGVDGDPEDLGDGRAVHTLQNPAVTHYQEDYVRKIIDTVNDLGNVLFEICNECNADSIPWQYHMIEFIKGYEATKPKQHPVGMTVIWPRGKNRSLFESPADWISPNGEGGYDRDPPAADGKKVIVADTDHMYGVGGDRSWVWKGFLSGLNLNFMDPYDNQWMYPPQPRSKDPQWEDVRLNMGYTRSFARRIDLLAMKPRPDLTTSGFCLANPTGQHPAFLIYIPSGGNTSVNLAGVSGDLTVEWFDPKSGSKQSGATVSGGGERSFAAPFGGDAVLYISRK